MQSSLSGITYFCFSWRSWYRDISWYKYCVLCLYQGWCFVFFVAVSITCPFTSISMQQNGKNTAYVEAFMLGSVIQVSFSPLTRVINSQRAKWDNFFHEVATVVQQEGIKKLLVPGLFFFHCKWPMEAYQRVTVQRVFGDHSLSNRIWM